MWSQLFSILTFQCTGDPCKKKKPSHSRSYWHVWKCFKGGGLGLFLLHLELKCPQWNSHCQCWNLPLCSLPQPWAGSIVFFIPELPFLTCSELQVEGEWVCLCSNTISRWKTVKMRPFIQVSSRDFLSTCKPELGNHKGKGLENKILLLLLMLRGGFPNCLQWRALWILF